MGVTNNNWQLLKAAVRFWGCYLACHGKKKQPGFLGAKVVLYFVAMFSFQRYPTKGFAEQIEILWKCPQCWRADHYSKWFPSIYLAGFLLKVLCCFLKYSWDSPRWKDHHQVIQTKWPFWEWLSARFKGCKGDLQCLGIKFGHDLKLGKELHRIHGHPNGDETPCAEALGVFFSGRTPHKMLHFWMYRDRSWGSEMTTV